MWIISNAGMGFSFCFITGFAAGYANTGAANLGIALVPFIFITYGFYDLAWIALNYTYVAEFLPYNMRTKGLGECCLLPLSNGQRYSGEGELVLMGSAVHHLQQSVQCFQSVCPLLRVPDEALTADTSRFVNPYALEAISWR